MAIIKPFRAWRPRPEFAQPVASRPYDVLNTEEAIMEAKGNPFSFLHVVKPEIDFPLEMNPYAPAVYEKGKENFEALVRSQVLFQDQEDSIYIYRLTMNGKAQTGIVALAAIEDYFNDVIKKHELTRPDKEEDRKQHVRIGQMHAEPVFFAYPAFEELDNLIEGLSLRLPDYDFVAVDSIRHQLWKVSEANHVALIVSLFSTIPSTYVADGHHRTAAAALVGKELRDANPYATGDEAYNFFMAVHFPDTQLTILDYNRLVRDLNGYGIESFIQALEKNFFVSVQAGTYKPEALHDLGMYLGGLWYKLTAKPGTYNDEDPIGVLDVSVLSKNILEPLLNIVDLRRDKRIDFVGGMRGLGELEKRVNSGEMAAAFALYPVSMKQLIDIADTGNIMPPKTTWFEPKLRSGLFVHKFA